jgi:hypothetical protein
MSEEETADQSDKEEDPDASDLTEADVSYKFKKKECSYLK